MIPSFDTARRMPAEIDLALLWSSLFLLMLGMVMVYSASIAIAEGGRFAGNNPAYFLVRHGVFLAIGLVAQGVGIWIGVQGFINMGVNMGMLPTKGLTLPLMSFGGSGILANCVALGIVLRVDWENRQLMRGGKL